MQTLIEPTKTRKRQTKSSDVLLHVDVQFHPLPPRSRRRVRGKGVGHPQSFGIHWVQRSAASKDLVVWRCCEQVSWKSEKSSMSDSKCPYWKNKYFNKNPDFLIFSMLRWPRWVLEFCASIFCSVAPADNLIRAYRTHIKPLHGLATPSYNWLILDMCFFFSTPQAVNLFNSIPTITQNRTGSDEPTVPWSGTCRWTMLAICCYCHWLSANIPTHCSMGARTKAETTPSVLYVKRLKTIMIEVIEKILPLTLDRTSRTDGWVLLRAKHPNEEEDTPAPAPKRRPNNKYE